MIASRVVCCVIYLNVDAVALEGLGGQRVIVDEGVGFCSLF